MGTLSLLPLTISSLLKHYHHSSPKPNLVNQTLSSKFCSIELPTSKFCRKSKKNDSFESQFLDEEGTVDDMDGFMNQLSLEYDSVWDTKPSWCQPWTITLTGVLVTVFSWIILNSVVISTIVLSLICAWWYIFLYAYPKAYSDMIAERRKQVNSGVEDTFGLRKS
ncbi:hypothetical protein AQUCO_04900234v1 [Aquilegia coerulea]|uniref:DUF6737 domain-containing protein n=1 Tax=Aquilegia coerulea TaxID=218851 RepID=A0A2G5CKK2_AQUCA|nr:hypothetical protein AQUCO_04900234v1 [Aquilegia coerulea]